jgi:hypothetical protein
VAAETDAAEPQRSDGGSALDVPVTGHSDSDGAACQQTPEMDKELLTLVFLSNSGGIDTITKLKLASLYSIGDLKLCSKSDLLELGITIGNANRLLAAVSKKNKSA